MQEGVASADIAVGPTNSGGGTGGSVSITATTPVVVTPSPTTGTGVISHAASGVAAATYGDATNVAQVAVDAKGHITTASNVPITGLGLGVLTRIAQVVCAGSQATVHFASIPQTYTTLMIVYQAQDTQNAGALSFRCKVNGDATAANYSNTQWHQGSGGLSQANTIGSTVAGCVIGEAPGTATATNVAQGTITIANYTNTTFAKTLQSEIYECSASSTFFILKYGFSYRAGLTVAPWPAVSDLVFTCGGTAFTNGSVFTLYGMP